MNITPQESLPTLLNFALEAYAKPEVEGLCLELQDRYGGQVNLLLWAAWLDAQKAPLDRALLVQAQLSIATQERYWLRPIRRLRRATPRTYSKLRCSMKRLELRAEYWQLRRLMICSPVAGFGGTALDVKVGGYRLAYLRSLGTPNTFQYRAEMLLC